MSRTVYRTSVRALAEFIFRSGDIDNRISQTGALKAMQEGSRIHRMLQAAAGSSYHAEVSLTYEISCENYDLKLDGRADGIMDIGDAEFQDAVSEPPEAADGLAPVKITAFIDEIKSTSSSLEKLEEPVFVHLAQAKCYAYMYARREGLNAVGVQMTYVYAASAEKRRTRGKQTVQEEAEQIRYFRYAYPLGELEVWFDSLIGQYCKWLDYLWDWKQKRSASIHDLAFPFPYREGQKDLAAGVYRTIARGKQLFLQAPTGTGKTMAVLYPSVKAMGEGIIDRIFYLTARSAARQAAVNAVSVLHADGLRMKYVLLTAKEKMCLCGEMLCDPEHCPYAKGHFDRINDAVYDLLLREESFDRQTILDAAAEYKVCPFELSLDLTDWTDAIICDYNYVFDPQVKLKRYFADGNTGEYLFLVDEAHNLVDRAREMYSASLTREDFLNVRRILKPVNRRADSLLGSVNRALLQMKHAAEELAAQQAQETVPARREEQIQKCSSVGKLDLTLLNLQTVLDEILREHRSFEGRETVQELYFGILRFLQILDLVDDSYITYTRIAPDGKFTLKLFCVNPAENLQRCCDSGVSTVFFSATLLPVRYYISLLSKEENPYTIYAKSSFSDDQKLLLAAADVSSRYTRRSPEEYARVAAYLQCMVNEKKGNYIAFFPSYRVLEDVYAQFSRTDGGKTQVQLQNSHMTPDEREAFLEAFEQERTQSLLAFCVMGGVFSEGIDLTEDQLIGVAIYGTGLPQVNAELSLVQDYYQRCGLDGFAYAYQYPGMNKVQQAAGRLIRTAADRGVILLLDERFLRSDYRRLFPREWADVRVTDLWRVRTQIAAFWNGRKKDPPGGKAGP